MFSIQRSVAYMRNTKTIWLHISVSLEFATTRVAKKIELFIAFYIFVDRFRHDSTEKFNIPTEAKSLTLIRYETLPSS